MVVLEPWRVGITANKAGDDGKSSTYLSDLVKSVGLDGSHGSTKSTKVTEYTQEWEHHVLSHLPFYLDLVPMFLELSVSRVAARGEPSVLDVVKVLRVFERSEALVGTLQDVERDANRYYASEPRRSDGTYAEILPWVIDQAENWKRFARDLGDEGAEGALGGTAARAPAVLLHVHSGQHERGHEPDSVDRCRDPQAFAAQDAPGLVRQGAAQVRRRQDVGRRRPSLDMDGADCGAYGYGWNRNGKTGPVRKIDRSTWRGATFKGTSCQSRGPRTRSPVWWTSWCPSASALNPPDA